MTGHVFEAGTAVEVRAFHVMPGMPPPEGERHAHDYRLEVVARRAGLDDRGMVADLDVLAAALQDVRDRVEGRDLDGVVDGGAEGVTVEVFARWVHGVVAAALGAAPLELGVRVWESPVAFGGYLAPVVAGPVVRPA